MIIYLDLLLPASSSGTPKSGPGKPIAFLLPCFGWGLHVPCLLPAKRWALTPPFHPYRLIPAVYFCCTSLRVTPTGRYPASCPAKPGLSSPKDFGAIIRLTKFRVELYHVLMCPVKRFRDSFSSF